MKLLFFIFLSFLCFLPYASIANDNNKALATKIELLLKTNIKYIDKKNNTKKVPYSIKFEVFIINKTKQDLVISSDDNDLRFFINYKSTKNREFKKKPLFKIATIFFSAGGTTFLKAESYSKVEFEYQFPEHALNQYVIENKYHIFQGWCEYLSGDKIKSNIVNIPIILTQSGGGFSRKNTLCKNEQQTEKSFVLEKNPPPDILELKANGGVFINGKKVATKDIPNELKNKEVIAYFDKDSKIKDTLAVLEQIKKSNASSFKLHSCPVQKENHPNP